MAVPTFKQAWAVKEAEGFRYGSDAMEQVRFGWNLREGYQYAELTELRTENSRLREALTPFIEPEGKQLTRPRSDHEQVPVVVTWGEYRRARAALRQGGGGSDG